MQKELYEAPEVQVIEMEVQGMIAASTDGFSIDDVDKGDW